MITRIGANEGNPNPSHSSSLKHLTLNHKEYSHYQPKKHFLVLLESGWKSDSLIYTLEDSCMT